jgi:hypothetical protein
MSRWTTFKGLLVVTCLMLAASAESQTREEPRSELAARQEHGDRNPVLHWNRIANEIFPVDVGPVIDARAMAILHAAIHDAVNGIEPRYEPYAASLSSPGASIAAAVASAARDVMLALTPAQKVRVEREYVAALADVPDGRAKADDGIVPGPWPPQQGPITEPIYVPTGRPGDYDFTPPFDAPPLGPIALFPGLGRVTPFVVDVTRHRLKGPDPLGSKRYARDIKFLTAYGRLEGSARTQDQTETAFFWFEPFGIWNDIARAVLEREHAGPWQAARVLALTNFAMMDAGIACFAAKYQFRFWRPYTAIRRAGEDGNDKTDADPDWLPLLWTQPGQPLLFLIPPIPDYPSAAAMTSAAAAEVLTRHFGRSVRFAVTSVTLPGAVRRFRSFSHAAREAGMSRVFGGIHFVHAVEDGWAAGESVGRDVARALPRRRR